MTPDQVLDAAIKLLTALTAGAGVLIGLSARHKTKAEAQTLEDKITDNVLTRAQKDMDRMQLEINELRAELSIYRVWNSMLCNQVITLGQEPVSMPEKRRSE